jgi:hypothetical protein
LTDTIDSPVKDSKAVEKCSAVNQGPESSNLSPQIADNHGKSYKSPGMRSDRYKKHQLAAPKSTQGRRFGEKPEVIPKSSTINFPYCEPKLSRAGSLTVTGVRSAHQPKGNAKPTVLRRVEDMSSIISLHNSNSAAKQNSVSNVGISPAEGTSNIRPSRMMYGSFLSSTTNRIQQFRSQILNSLKGRQTNSESRTPTLEILEKEIEMNRDDLLVTNTEPYSKPCSNSSSKSTSLSLAALKDLLKDPSKTGVEMSVVDYKKLEKSSTLFSSSTGRGCMKKRPSSQQQLDAGTIESDFSTQVTDSESKLKRGVSFSENVVMFIYQA